MSSTLSSQLEAAVTREAAELSKADASQAGLARPHRAWTMKQELGHLIDSAANNHQRFVRAAIDGSYRGPGYQQDEWVLRNGYAETQWDDLVELWRRYNLLLVRAIGRIPEDRLKAECIVGDGAPVSLRFLIEDYIMHMQHHLDQILARESVTQYPQVTKPS